MTITERVVVNIIENIDAFDLKTSNDQYTDPGEIWDLLNDIRDELNESLPGYLQADRGT